MRCYSLRSLAKSCASQVARGLLCNVLMKTPSRPLSLKRETLRPLQVVRDLAWRVTPATFAIIAAGCETRYSYVCTASSC